MIRVALIGTGAMVDFHLKAIAQNPDSELCAVCAAHMESAERSAKPWGVAAYDDYTKMLETEKPDAVIINLPHWLHEPCTKVCAEHGCHILLEKPMSVSGESCRRMIDMCKKNNVLLQVAHPQGHMAETIMAREIIESGELGELIMIQTQRSTTYYNETRPKWFWKKETAGGGIWINLGAHCLDQFCQLTGSPIKSITGKCTYIDGMDVDASAQAFIESESGVTGTITLSGYNWSRNDECTIHLTKGSMKLRGWVDLFISRGDDEWEKVDCSKYGDPFFHQWDTFMDAIKENKVTWCTGEYSANIIETIEQLWK